MCLDYVSFETSHEQLADTVQRSGIRNFALPLQNGHYIEIVCLLDHPESDTSPFGKGVSKRGAEGGSWLAWEVAFDDVSKVEARLGRQAVDAHRAKPDSHNLSWNQMGILGNLEEKHLSFFIEWKSLDQSSTGVKVIVKILRIEIAETEKLITDWLGSKLARTLGSDVKVISLTPVGGGRGSGIVALYIMTASGVVSVN
jgi:hypothetical protein